MTSKPKAKRRTTAREKKAREYRRAFERVCDLLADGPKNSVKEITEDKKIGLSRSGFYKMLYGGGGDLVDRYARAREMQADRMAEEILAIADDGDGDVVVVKKKGRKGDKAEDFEIHADHEAVHRSRLRVDTRKWLAGKLRPKVYGDKQVVDVNHGLEKMNDDELMARAKQLADRLGITLPEKLLKPARHQGTG